MIFNEATIKQVKLLTYNIFMRPPLINNNGNDYKNERCELMLQQLDKFDIICFQELFGLLNMRKMRIKHKAFKKGFIYQAVSPSPSFFSGSLVDGGLVTLSRYPILKEQFQQYQYGVLSDNLALKGIVYTKIDIHGSILHLFNTHLQASYIGSEENVSATVMTRIDQMKTYRKFLIRILEKENATSKDLILLVGDFNVDALHSNQNISVLDLFPDIKQALNLQDNSQLYNEYQALMTILSNSQQDRISDIIKDNHQGQSQITYADSCVDEEGERKPLETLLTCKEDTFSNQCLDYILQFKRLCSLEQSSLQISNNSVMIEKFLTTGQIFQQLSDHYGLSCILLQK